MRISARCDYACRAILELALHWPNKKPLQVRMIAKRQRIPVRYLTHILIQLKKIGLVRSSRGREGGYNLSQPPRKIRLGEVMRLVGGPLLPAAECAANNGSLFESIWTEVELSMAKVLDKVTFEDVVNKANGIKGTIVYQI